MIDTRPFKPLTVARLTALGASLEDIEEYFNSLNPPLEESLIEIEEEISSEIQVLSEEVLEDTKEILPKQKKPRKPYVFKKPKTQRKRKHVFPIHWSPDIQRKYLSYQYRSLRKGNCFDLSHGEFESLLSKGECIYCGDSDDLTIDRINSKLGYTLSNCQTCCNNCNSLKTFLSERQFLKQVEKVYKHIFLSD